MVELKKKDEFCERLNKLEPKIDLTHEIAGCGQFVEMSVTSDGFFLGRRPGDIGFNAFMGNPSDIARQRTKTLYDKMNDKDKKEFKSRLARQQIPLKAAGIE